jgi:tetratricopeptide (TPR) repeat protein
MRLAIAIGLLAALAGPARADEDTDTRARAHYEIGLGLYRLGDYRAALREFAAGYELAPKPGFLINLGQTYRKLGDLAHARDMYRRFLAEVPASDPARAQAQQVLVEIEAQVREQPPRPEEPVPPVPPVPSPSPSPAPTPEVRPAPVATVTATPPPKPRPRRLGMRVAGAVLTVGGAALLAVGIGEAFAADSVARDLNTLDSGGGVFDSGKDRAYTTDRAVEGAGFGVGAALAATGVVLLIVGTR